MKTKLQILQNPEFGEVRFIVRHGEPWFVGKDIAEALGYANNSDAITKHCKHAKLFTIHEVPELEINPRGMFFITESDVHRLIMRSKLPSADKFQSWITQTIFTANSSSKSKLKINEEDTMETGLELFQNAEFGNIRVIMRDGEPWFAGKDVAHALGYTDTDNAIRNRCKYPELFKSDKLLGLTIGPRGMFFIPESDLYRLIIRSKLPNAEKFETWVTENILPTLRKTGQYVMSNQQPYEVPDPTKPPYNLPDFTKPAVAARAWANVQIR